MPDTCTPINLQYIRPDANGPPNYSSPTSKPPPMIDACTNSHSGIAMMRTAMKANLAFQNPVDESEGDR